ncbi:ion channel [Ancylobacter pratisalsi]|uniref:Two pore domain potassium channel family protein n=1 Tax=Ancylobacter pratisalsi TaxID=1745854 RepID=A0A6P1YNK4_9HYPH|nr:ion channel [Ancylobacter pratisalsi]QIB33334.1 two pore domain potassium channel family protein [Ancylobacter pratisalsi]
MLNELMTGASVNVAVMLVHLGATAMLMALTRPFAKTLWKHPHMRLTFALLTANIILLSAHLVEVGIWAGVYTWLGLVPNPSDAYYTAFVNYTTLGYGDALQVTRTRLLGPMAAGSGIMMFGWTTALLIYVLQSHLPQLLGARSEA